MKSDLTIAKHPAHLTLKDLLTPFPIDWKIQRKGRRAAPVQMPYLGLEAFAGDLGHSFLDGSLCARIRAGATYQRLEGLNAHREWLPYSPAPASVYSRKRKTGDALRDCCIRAHDFLITTDNIGGRPRKLVEVVERRWLG